MIILFRLFSETYGKTIGYFIPYGIYLMILLIGIVLFKGKEKKESSDNISSYGGIFYALSFVPVIATFFVAFLPTLPHITFKLLLILIPYAIINGTLEELFWRFTFNRQFSNDILCAYIVPSIIFTCWHFALACAQGVSYNGGTLALVGGAGVMGAIWGLTMLKTKNVKVIICAHVIVNFFAFSQLLYENWFV